MSLYGALYSSVAGLAAQSNKIGIISDNISNVNTVGYKQGTGQFETLVTSSGLASAYSPGGVLSSNHQLISKQGLIQGTSNAGDLAISGGGFFAVNTQKDSGGAVLYTRVGSFKQDNLGNFVNSSGFYLQGWPLDREGRLPGASGNSNTNSSSNLTSLTTVNVLAATGAAADTTKVNISANLKASETVYPGSGATAELDVKTVNASLPAKSIIVPGEINHSALSGNVNSIERGDRLAITTGSGLSYTYRYGGFTYGRDANTGANGDSGASVMASPITLGANSFTTGSAGSKTVTVATAAPHGLSTGDVITLSGESTAVDGIPASDFNQKFVVTVVDATHFTIQTPTAATSGSTTGGDAGLTVITRPFAGNIFDATTSAQAFLGTTGINNFQGSALSFSVTTQTTGTISFTYTSSTPNAQLGQFNSLENLADAINSTSGLTARVSGGRLYVGAADANEAVSFANGNTSGTSGPPVKAGIDWVRELGLANVAVGDDRFNSLQSLANMVKGSAGLDANVSNPLTDASLKMNVKDPLDNITFSDPSVAAPLTPFASATPFTTTSGSKTVTVNCPTPHGLKTGDIVTLDVSTMTTSGATNYNGIPLSNFNGRFEVTVTGPSTYTINTATAASATGVDSTPGGGGASFTGLVMTPPNNTGSLVAELGLVPTLNGGAFSVQTLGPIGPQYDASSTSKNMASGSITPQYNQNVRVYDSLGTAHDLKMGFVKISSNTWAAEIYATNTNDVSDIYSNGLLASGTLTFNGDGSLRSVSSGLAGNIQVLWSGGAKASGMEFNWGSAGEPFGSAGALSIGKTDGMSQFDSPYKVNFVNQNGASVGELLNVSFTDDGYVVANYNNGQSQKLYKLPIANFSNPDQLSSVTGNVFEQTAASGEANLREAGTNGAGTIQSSALESSTVELADQLTDLIVAQRAYQANTKLITTADNLLEELNQTIR